MTEWLDDDHLVGEMPDEEFEAAVRDTMDRRIAKEQHEGKPLNYGNDGYVMVYQEGFRFHAVRCTLQVLRYWWVTRNPDGPVEVCPATPWSPSERHPGWKGLNRVGRHVVLEPVEGNESPLPNSELLWRDSLHGWQDEWTLRQQWDDMLQSAEADCRELSLLVAIKAQYAQEGQDGRDTREE